MFSKVLIANRGEIAVRIIRACREMGITTVALYEAADQGSLHVRLADECVRLDGPGAFFDQDGILAIAHRVGADAIHPGYGFLAENAAFIDACAAAGVAFVGPSAETVRRTTDKMRALETAAAAGFPTVRHSPRGYGADEDDALREQADTLGYPLVVKSVSGGRGHGERLVTRRTQLERAVRRARAEARANYNDVTLYLERAILPAHQVGVQILADRHGHCLHLGDREGSILAGNQKVVEECPAPCLSADQRAALGSTAVALARLFGYDNAGTVEFLVDPDGQFYFSEIKARIQVEHSLTEMVSGIDLVQAQLRCAAGEPLRHTQAAVRLAGHAIMARIHAENPWERFLPAPGRLTRVRFPQETGLRVDSYVYCDADVPAAYDPLVAKLTAWAEDRGACIGRIRCALEDTKLVGTFTNVPYLQQIVAAPAFVAGQYDTGFALPDREQLLDDADHIRRLAAVAAVLYVRRNQLFMPSVPDRALSGWHRSSRRLPQ